jgi:hypothetical protein
MMFADPKNIQAYFVSKNDSVQQLPHGVYAAKGLTSIHRRREAIDSYFHCFNTRI